MILIKKILIYIALSILSIVIGLLLEKLFTIILEFVAKRNEAERIKEADEYLKDKHRILSLSHKTPRFRTLGKSDLFFIPFPKEYQDDVKKYNPMFLQDAVADWVVFDTSKEQGPETLAKLLYGCIENAKKLYSGEKEPIATSFEELKSIILDSRNNVATDFVDHLKKGYIRFNGVMFGVKEIKQPGDHAIITLFKTDYFTNRVMNKVYNTLAKRGIIKDFTSLELVNNFYPLMTALGVDTIVQLHNRTTMLVKRSELLENMEKKPLWHVSMNEAISWTDYKDDDRIDTAIDEKRCVRRGLYEELHIPDSAIDSDSVRFTDVYFLMGKCEIGIASTVKLKKAVTEKLIRFAHYGAKDSMLESKELMKTLVLTKYCIKKFIKEQDEGSEENAKEEKQNEGLQKKEDKGITESCRYVLTMMMCRMH